MRTNVSVVDHYPQIFHYREDKTHVNSTILKPHRKGVKLSSDINYLFISQCPKDWQIFFPMFTK